MRAKSVETILAENLAKLTGYDPVTGRCSLHPQTFLVNKRDPDSGVSQATIGRILRAEASASVGVVQKIAAYFDLQPWQMLVEGLDRSNPPMLQSVNPSERALYESFKRAWREVRGSRDEGNKH